MQLISLVNMGGGVIPIKDKKRTSIVNAFKKNNLRRKPVPILKDEENQIKYGLINVVNLIIILLKKF